MPRHIKLMWDYQCWPLWETGGREYALEPESLPLSQATRERLSRWAAIPDTKLAAVAYPPDITWSAAEEKAFEAEGRALWRHIRRELGDGYAVSYHNPLAGPVCIPDDDTPA
jgi:hypothetical protein